MSKFETTFLSRVSGNRAWTVFLALCCVLAGLWSQQAAAAEGAEFAPLHTRPVAMADVDIRRHVPGASRTDAFPAAEAGQSDSAGLYRQVSRNFKFGLRYTRAVFSLAPAEALADDHYVFLNLVGML
ncbi:hypothetical protein [Thioalkalivibrio sp. XN279]|uniref:hypothetical protein n=1 Tax=Thioalkalivibrio sp. XN279 TaxID=2714953 RepID=UPI00140936F1|nr:hypothetical protein [Thioalkalivibrio sp. XN279]NHA14233.1 hypothetical protein [Thioalkalivibrio sp. XN279]